jgi:hypothetical protein
MEGKFLITIVAAEFNNFTWKLEPYLLLVCMKPCNLQAYALIIFA